MLPFGTSEAARSYDSCTIRDTTAASSIGEA